MPVPGSPAVTLVPLFVHAERAPQYELREYGLEEEQRIDGAQHEERRHTRHRTTDFTATRRAGQDRHHHGRRVDHVPEQDPRTAQPQRQERQQQVVRALLSRGAGFDIVTAVPELLSALEGHVRTDLGARDVVRIGQQFRSSCTAETLETARLEGTVEMQYDELMQQELSFVLVDVGEVQSKVIWLRGGRDDV